MALGLNTENGGGNFAEIIKYDSRAGRMFRVDRSQDGGGQWHTENIEITNGFQAVMDLDNIEVGWALFAAGVAPHMVMVKLGDAMPPRPSDQHKQCFRMMLKLGKQSGGDVREFVSQAKAVISAVDDLHTAFEAGKAANPGKLPLVALNGAKQITTTGKGQTSTNYSPTFEIARWLDRPADLTAGAAKAQPPSDPLPQSQPAQQARQPEPVGADGEEF